MGGVPLQSPRPNLRSIQGLSQGFRIGFRGGDSYSKVGGAHERRSPAARDSAPCDLRGFGDMQNVLGVFWVSEIEHYQLSSLFYRPAPLC